MKLHDKFGLNLSVKQCFICGQATSEIILFGAACKEEAPRMICVDKVPCDECKKWMEKGIILISVRDSETGNDPYRTGGWIVMKDEAIERWMRAQTKPECINSLKEALVRRVAFVEDRIWDNIGLPRH